MRRGDGLKESWYGSGRGRRADKEAIPKPYDQGVKNPYPSASEVEARLNIMVHSHRNAEEGWIQRRRMRIPLGVHRPNLKTRHGAEVVDRRKEHVEVGSKGFRKAERCCKVNHAGRNRLWIDDGHQCNRR